MCMKKLLLDIDGCVLNTCGGLKDYFEKQGKTFFPEKVSKYNFDCNCGVDRFEVYEALKTVELFEMLSPYEYAVEAVSKLQGLLTVEPWTVISDVKQLMVRRKNLIDVGLPSIGIYVKEKPILPCDYLVEDNPDIIEMLKGWENKPLLFLVDRPYNQGIDGKGIIRVKSLLDVYNYIYVDINYQVRDKINNSIKR